MNSLNHTGEGKTRGKGFTGACGALSNISASVLVSQRLNYTGIQCKIISLPTAFNISQSGEKKLCNYEDKIVCDFKLHHILKCVKTGRLLVAKKLETFKKI